MSVLNTLSMSASGNDAMCVFVYLAWTHTVHHLDDHHQLLALSYNGHAISQEMLIALCHCLKFNSMTGHFFL